MGVTLEECFNECIEVFIPQFISEQGTIDVTVKFENKEHSVIILKKGFRYTFYLDGKIKEERNYNEYHECFIHAKHWDRALTDKEIGFLTKT